jgi:hypothetical protein
VHHFDVNGGAKIFVLQKNLIFLFLDVYVFLIIVRFAQALKISLVASSVRGVFFYLVAVHLAKNQMGHGTSWSARAQLRA